MLTSRYKNPIPNFQAHGVKTVGLYQYILLIDLQGSVLIERVKTDNSEILFVKMPEGTDIATYWASADTYTYKYMNQI